MNDKLQELAMWLGLSTIALINQLGGDPEKAREIAEDAIGTMSDYYEMRKKIEDAHRNNDNVIYISGYKITF